MPQAQAPLASRASMPAGPGGVTPRSNLLLARLPDRDYRRLLPHLESIDLPAGWTLHSAGDREKYLHFIASGVVSKSCVMRDGATSEFAIAGREGVIGIAAFLGGESTPSQAVALSAVFAYRLPAARLQREIESGGALAVLLQRYTLALIAQTGQVAVCNRFHSVEQRLCRWILTCLDRLPSNELPMTQELVAEALGVRRESVTGAAGKLQEAGLVECHRGHWTVRDRPGLEARACECYAAIKGQYERLLQEPGRAG